MKRYIIDIEFCIDLPEGKNIYDYAHDVLFQDKAVTSASITTTIVIDLEDEYESVRTY